MTFQGLTRGDVGSSGSLGCIAGMKLAHDKTGLSLGNMKIILVYRFMTNINFLLLINFLLVFFS